MLNLVRKTLTNVTGGFSIDPMVSVEHAVITHAHADHARRGSLNYYTPHSGVDLLKVRIGKTAKVHRFDFGEKFVLRNVELSFHPAGHILGSAQVRMQKLNPGTRKPFGEVWLVSGDYKRDPDPTCEPFQEVKCDVFITEATFGTPAYQWPKGIDLGRQISEWSEENRVNGVSSVLFAYSLGKAQRVLGVLQPYMKRPVYCHPAATALTDCYRARGISLAPTICLSRIADTSELSGELFLVPQSFLKSSQSKLLGEKFETAFASGWMASASRRTYGGCDTGFVMSDHADWNDLVATVLATGAKRVYVQHRGNGALVRHLRNLGIQAFPDTALETKSVEQMSFL